MASPNLSAAQKGALDRILADAVASKITPALFLGVTTVDGPIYMHQAGTKLVDDPQSAAINEDTVFWLCSQTKLITTVHCCPATGRARQDRARHAGRKRPPELANPVVVGTDEDGHPQTRPATAKITLGHLLNHSSGLSYYNDPALTDANGVAVPYSHNYKDEDVSTFFKILKGSHPGVPLNFEPGTNFAYGFSTDCVGFIVERLSGKSLEQYFKDYIFTPLGITSASFYLTPALKERLLPLSIAKNGLLESWKGSPLMPQDPADVRVHCGGVGIYMSQKDYLNLLRHLLQIKGSIPLSYLESVGRIDTEIYVAGSATAPILSPASVDSMFTPTLPQTSSTNLTNTLNFIDPHLGLPEGSAQFGRGLCVNMVDIPGRRRAGSGAWGGWANTSYFVDPTTGIAVVFGSQVIPTGDTTHKRLLGVLEREIYAAL
ncbi:beta-lactamase [Mycena alexandri]|uniref:Beta-lactamase n=1 Tax=Mycena alexandri TaxID=1745969 RepID=A0AAD6TKC2_9AGAR|nr:beta-lactamase [Mycena alexandri]